MVQIDEKAYGLSKERLSSVFDSGTFVELGAYTKRSAADEPLGVVCGYGAVSGKLVFAFIQDGGRTKGVFEERHAKKIEAMYSLAVKNGAPVIGIFDSAGALVYDGASALASYGRLMKCVSDASGIIPQIALIGGICGGASSVISSMFDLTVTVKGASKLFVNPPFNAGESASVSAKGYSVFDANDEKEAYAYIRELLSILPENNAVASFVDSSDDAGRAVDIDFEKLGASEFLPIIADDGRFIEIYKDYAKNVKLGFASFGGVAAGVVACEKDCVLDIKSVKGISKLQGLCDSFGIPLVTFVNSIGFDKTAETEDSAYAEELARLAFAYTSSENAKVTAIVGKAYGASFTLLGSKSLGADMVFALPTAEISVLPPDASVAFVWNDRVGEESREVLEKEWKEKYASAENACELGEVDDVIPSEELRARICAALSMLCAKADGNISRKHIVLPL